MGRPLLQQGSDARLKCVDVELDLRAQESPHVEDDSTGTVDA